MTDFNADDFEPIFRDTEAYAAAGKLNEISREYQPSPVLSVADAMALLFVEALNSEDFEGVSAPACFASIIARLSFGVIPMNSDEECTAFFAHVAKETIRLSRSSGILLSSEGEHC